MECTSHMNPNLVEFLSFPMKLVILIDHKRYLSLSYIQNWRFHKVIENFSKIRGIIKDFIYCQNWRKILGCVCSIWNFDWKEGNSILLLRKLDISKQNRSLGKIRDFFNGQKYREILSCLCQICDFNQQRKVFQSLINRKLRIYREIKNLRQS